MNTVDVFVPCYRYGRYLRDCVTSILTQADVDVRVLIIDDASPDNTPDVASELKLEDSRVAYIRHEVNQGHIATYNEGIEWATAKYQLLLSADDYLLPGALSRATKLMDEHPEVGFTFGKAAIQYDGDQLELSSFKTEKESWRIFKGLDFIIHSGANNIVPTPTAVIRTALQQELGGYRSELPHTGDMEMWLRLAAHASVGMTEAYQAVYRRHSENMSSEYFTKSWLPDLKQRKAAFDVFIEKCRGVLPNAQRIHQKLLFKLARQSVKFANTSFNNGDTENMMIFLEFADQTSPNFKFSLPWVKLFLKRMIGHRAWSLVQSAKLYINH